MLLYLEDLEALEIAEVTGMSAVNVAAWILTCHWMLPRKNARPELS